MQTHLTTRFSLSLIKKTKPCHPVMPVPKSADQAFCDLLFSLWRSSSRFVCCLNALSGCAGSLTALELAPAETRRGFSLPAVRGFSWCRAWALGPAGSAVWHTSLVAPGMWGLPSPAIRHESPALAGGFVNFRPPGKSKVILTVVLSVVLCIFCQQKVTQSHLVLWFPVGLLASSEYRYPAWASWNYWQTSGESMIFSSALIFQGYNLACIKLNPQYMLQ